MKNERYIRCFPERIRTEIFGLQDNTILEQKLRSAFLSLPGVHAIRTCTVTGRVDIQFRSNLITVKEICAKIQELEENLPQCGQENFIEEVAVTVENAISSHPIQDPQLIPNDFSQIKRAKPSPKIPVGLPITLAGLGFLGMKQLLYGRSKLASSPALFGLSGIMSIVTGYPFLRRGLKKYTEQKKIDADVILGTAAIGLGLLRENMLVLAGLSILQYINWQRKKLDKNQVEQSDQEPLYIAPNIQKYSERIGKWAFPLAGTAWLLTRNPWTGLAVLLAMNPRLVLSPTIATWKQAETIAMENGLPLPKNGTLAQVARSKTLIIEDSGQIFHPSSQEIALISDEKSEQIWRICSALLAKSSHAWKESISEKARASQCSKKTAFSVVGEIEGVSGIIAKHQYYLGTLEYIEQKGFSTEPHTHRIRQLQKQGAPVYALVRKVGDEAKCIAVLYQLNQATIRSYLSLRKQMKMRGWKIALLRNSLGIRSDVLRRFSIDTDWLDLSSEGQLEKLRVLQQNEEEVLLWVHDKYHPWQRMVPSMQGDEIKKLHELIDHANQVEKKIQKRFQFTRFYNLFGVALAIPFGVSAMLINLTMDALSLLFLSNRKNTKKMEVQPISVSLAETSATISLAEEEDLDWHKLSPEQIPDLFASHPQTGLTSSQVEMYKKRFGSNILAKQSNHSWGSIFFHQFREFTSLLLIGTSVLSFFTGDFFHGLAMGLVLLVNAAIGTIQERKAEKVVEALNEYHAPSCRVIRDGQEIIIDGEEVVPGDLVCIEAGDRVPADIRLLEAWNLEVDESMLTGESLPVQKNAESIKEEAILSERSNMLFKGTHISKGKGYGIVIATGMQTEMGRLMSHLTEEKQEMTPLQQEVATISKNFVKVALGIVGLIFTVGLVRGVPLHSMISTSIALAVSAIPEGLPITVTIALSAGIFRMVKKKALIRKLSALETLGRVSVICTDKTGTLTKNEMTVRSVATLSNKWKVTGEGYSPEGTLISAQPLQGGQQRDLQQLVRIASLCNNTQLFEESGKWKVQGDPTEGALIRFASKTGYDPAAEVGWRREHEIPFDSCSKRMSVVCKEQENCYVFTKGSIESILSMCSYAQVEGEIIPLTEEQKQSILETNTSWSRKSLRVLAFAYRFIDWTRESEKIAQEEFIFVGMVGMIDPPKPGIQEVIQHAYQLGMKTVMITGDHPLTAEAIAKEVGIHENPCVMTGRELDQLTDEDLREKVGSVHVFARVTPEHKVRVVRAYQSLGQLVAMTGDGVNDTPSIKVANVGIAMGQTGTEVTKETADMVLQQDDFTSVIHGVKEGRTVISNIRKALGCLLTGNLAEILVTGAAVLIGMPIPLVPIQILLMNLLTDALPAMILATNPGKKNSLEKRIKIADRDLYSKVVVRGVFLGVASLTLFGVSLMMGASLPVARTITFATLVCAQLIQTFSWRQEGSSETIKDCLKDRFLVGALGISFLTLLAAIYVPFLSTFFHTVPLSLNHWLKVLLVAGSVTTVSRIFLRVIQPAKKGEAPIPNLSLVS